MTTSVKQLIIVLTVASVVFALMRPIALLYTDEADYARRRNVWLILTGVALLSPSFWIFAAVAIPLLSWAGSRDSNVVGLYLLLMQVIPSAPIELPTFGIVKKLFDLDMYRLLSLLVLIPAALRLRHQRTGGLRHFDVMDALLLLYGLLQVMIYVRPDMQTSAYAQDSVTNALRRGWLFFIDAYLLYWVVSRSSDHVRSIADAMMAFTLSACIMAPLAVFETVRHWLLYSDIAIRWGTYVPLTAYLFRAGSLRAVVSAGQPTVLGYVFAIAFGFWLYLGAQVRMGWRLGVSALLWFGLFAAYSRGPWLGAVLILFSFAAFSPGAARSLLKFAGVSVMVSIAVLLSPLGKSILSVLPFFGGQVDAANIIYREQLADRAWQLVQQHPWLGDPFAYSNLQELRQGQGIIDLVNTYAQVAMFYGFIGLSMFLLFMLIPFWRTYRASRMLAAADPHIARLGASLIGCIIGTFAMIYTTSFMFDIEKLYYVLAGLAAGYVVFAQRLYQAQVQQSRPIARPASARAYAAAGHRVPGWR